MSDPCKIQQATFVDIWNATIDEMTTGKNPLKCTNKHLIAGSDTPSKSKQKQLAVLRDCWQKSDSFKEFEFCKNMKIGGVLTNDVFKATLLNKPKSTGPQIPPEQVAIKLGYVDNKGVKQPPVFFDAYTTREAALHDVQKKDKEIPEIQPVEITYSVQATPMNPGGKQSLWLKPEDHKMYVMYIKDTLREKFFSKSVFEVVSPKERK